MTVRTVPNRDPSLLHPKAELAFRKLLDEMIRLHEAGATQAKFQLFEGFRHPLRQIDLRKQGTSKATMWQSAHQYGLAIDVVPYIGNVPTWRLAELGPDDLTVFDRAVHRCGLLRPISWDPFHIEHPLWLEVKKLVL